VNEPSITARADNRGFLSEIGLMLARNFGQCQTNSRENTRFS